MPNLVAPKRVDFSVSSDYLRAYEMYTDAWPERRKEKPNPAAHRQHLIEQAAIAIVGACSLENYDVTWQDRIATQASSSVDLATALVDELEKRAQPPAGSESDG